MALGVCGFAGSQEASIHLETVQWDGDDLVQPHAADGVAVLVTRPDGTGYKVSYPGKEGGGFAVCLDGVLFLSRWSVGETPEGPKGITRLFRFEARKGTWELDSVYRADAPLGLTTIIPLKKEGTYLGLSALPLKLGDDKGPFITLRKNDRNELEPIRVEDADLDKPILTYPGLFGFLDPPTLAVTDEAIVLCDSRSGTFFIFDATSGRFKRSLPIFDSIDEKHLRRNDLFADAILGFQPTPGGRILVATREEDLVLHGKQLLESELKTLKDGVSRDQLLFQGMANNRFEAPAQDPPARDREGPVPEAEPVPDPGRNLEEAIRMNHSGVLWWELDPMHGKPARLNPPPPGAAESWAGDWRIQDFAWRWVPSLNGVIRHLSPETLGKALDGVPLLDPGPEAPGVAPRLWISGTDDSAPGPRPGAAKGSEQAGEGEAARGEGGAALP